MSKYILSMLVVCLCACTPHASWSTPADSYQLTDLGEVLNVFALDKSSDTIVSTRLLDGLQRAVVLGALERVVDLLPDGLFVIPFGVDRGRVVGLAGTGPFSLQGHAFVFDEADGIRDLGTLGGPELFSQANDVNPVDIVGSAERPEDHRFVPVVFPGGGPPVPLPLLGDPGPLAFPILGSALALNDRGTIVGDTQTDTGAFHATLWPADDRSSPQDLQTLPEAQESLAFDLNEHGRVVGIFTDQGGRAQGFVWTHRAGMRPLPPLEGDISSTARAINDAGDSVGQSLPEEGQSAAVVWDRHRQPIRLQDRVVDDQGIRLVSGVGLNTAGTIAALGFLGEELHAVLLTPAAAPEPPPPPRRKHRHPMSEAAVQALLHMAR